MQYTSQVAHQAICGASIIGGQEGYNYALKTLKSLYDSKHIITESIIKPLRNPKPVKSAQDVCALSHELRNTFHVLQSVDSLAEVNAQVIIFDTVTRLPNFVHNRWDKEEFKSKHNSDTYLKFENLVHFVE